MALVGAVGVVGAQSTALFGAYQLTLRLPPSRPKSIILLSPAPGRFLGTDLGLSPPWLPWLPSGLGLYFGNRYRVLKLFFSLVLMFSHVGFV